MPLSTTRNLQYMLVLLGATFVLAISAIVYLDSGLCIMERRNGSMIFIGSLLAFHSLKSVHNNHGGKVLT